MTDQEDRGEKFNERRCKCSVPVRAVLDFLQTVAAHAGDAVEVPSFDGVEGVGVSYVRDGRRFCRFDPKIEVEHVFACVPGASLEELAVAGTMPDPPRKDDGWVKVENMRGAVRLVPLILRSYDEA